MSELKTETPWSKFNWRITKEYTRKNCKINEYYYVEKQYVLFNLIKFWWTKHWHFYYLDAINFNKREFKTYEKAEEYLLYWKNKTDYENQDKILKKEILN